jgi:hypothetical protein
MLTEAGDIYRVDSGEYDGQAWRAETDLTAGRNIDVKHIQKVQILADVGGGSSLRADLLYYGEDGSVRERKVFDCANQSGDLKRKTIRVVPRLTAHWGVKLRLSGVGFSRVYQAEITLKGGGALYGGKYGDPESR